MNITDIANFFLKIDESLYSLVQAYGVLVYPILFLIIFVETGLVIMPFLPGDSLLFAAGAIAAVGKMNIFLLFLILSSAAVLGDSVNYWIGNKIGVKIVSPRYKKYIQRTEEFYSRHGGKTIVFARFIPFIRTFAPFVAGVGRMNYLRFFLFNVFGGILWTSLFLFAGYFFGNLPFVEENLVLIILAIIIISILPIMIEAIRIKLKKKANRDNFEQKII